MSEYAEGGLIKDGQPVDVRIFKDDYIIPVEFARVWGESFLKKLNKELDSTEPDVLD